MKGWTRPLRLQVTEKGNAVILFTGCTYCTSQAYKFSLGQRSWFPPNVFYGCSSIWAPSLTANSAIIFCRHTTGTSHYRMQELLFFFNEIPVLYSATAGAGGMRNRGWLLRCRNGEEMESKFEIELNRAHFWNSLTVDLNRCKLASRDTEIFFFKKSETLRWNMSYTFAVYMLIVIFLYHTAKTNALAFLDEFIMSGFFCIRARATVIW